MELEHHQLDLRYEGLRVFCEQGHRRLLAAIAERGQLIPGVVVDRPNESPRYALIDGFKRLRVLRKLGHDTLRVVTWDVEESEALMMWRSLRAAQAETALEQAWLLDELRSRFEWPLDTLASQFCRSVSWVSRRLGLIHALPDSVQDSIRCGRIVPHAAAKHLIPLARANREHCERLGTAVENLGLSSSDIGQLYAGWRDGSTAGRERLIADPALYLRTRASLGDGDEAEGHSLQDRLLKDVNVISAVARRVGRRVREGALSELSTLERDGVVGGLKLAWTELERLNHRVSESLQQMAGEPSC